MREYTVASYRHGYIIGIVDGNGKVLYKASRVYLDKDRAEADLEAGKFNKENYEKGHDRYPFSIDIMHYVIVSETKEGLQARIHIVNHNPDSEIYKLTQKNSLVGIVYYNKKENNIVDYYLHNEKLDKVDYKFNDEELQRIADKIFHYLNAREVLKKRKKTEPKVKVLRGQIRSIS